MDIEVKPLAITQVDWNMYKGFFNQVIGGSVTYDLDAHYMTTDDLAAFLTTFAPGHDPRIVLRNNNIILKHVAASFITNAPSDSIIKIMEAGLHATIFEKIRNTLTIMSGDLLQWKQAIIDLSNPNTIFEVRFIMNSCCLYFEKAGLNELFGNYSKKILNDKTFILREK